MKKMLAFALTAVMAASLAACGSSTPKETKAETAAATETVAETTAETEAGETEATATEAGDYTLGMGVVVSTKSSKAGTAQVDATVAAVVFDGEGKIVKCELDVAQTKLDVTDGAIPEDLTEVDVRSKHEKQEDYGMKSASSIGAEWMEQADAFANSVIGMTADEVVGLELTENNGHNVLADETLHASCSMDVTAFQAAIAKAAADEYAKSFSADTFTLGLGVNTSVDSSKAPEEDKDGVAALYTNFAAAVVDANGAIVVDLIDVIQPKVEFDAAGEIVTDSAEYDAAFLTKKELKEGYGMLVASKIGVEWMDQATGFENYVVGMTADQVTGIETVENNGHNVAADETLHASCSMGITEFQATLAKAFANAR